MRSAAVGDRGHCRVDPSAVNGQTASLHRRRTADPAVAPVDADRRRRVRRVVGTYAGAATLWIGSSALAVAIVARTASIPPMAAGLVASLTFLVATSLLLHRTLLRWSQRLSAATEVERRAAEDLGEVNRIRAAFLDSISHELRTPLTNILGFAQTIRAHHRTLESEDIERFSDRLVVNTARLERLVVDLLELHREDAGAPPEVEPVHVERLLQAAISATRPRSQRLYVRSPVQWVGVDKDKLERIVAELIGNVVRHTPDETVAWLQALTDGGWLHISIEDDGPGVDPSIIDQVSQPFIQGSEARQSPSPGLGIGLALTARYAELLGGRMSISTPTSGGTRVDVIVPYRSLSTSPSG